MYIICVCVCVSVSVCVCVCAYTYKYIHISMYTHTHTCVCACVRVCVCVRACVCNISRQENESTPYSAHQIWRLHWASSSWKHHIRESIKIISSNKYQNWRLHWAVPNAHNSHSLRKGVEGRCGNGVRGWGVELDHVFAPYEAIILSTNVNNQ